MATVAIAIAIAVAALNCGGSHLASAIAVAALNCVGRCRGCLNAAVAAAV